jgi:hypothetical protein
MTSINRKTLTRLSRSANFQPIMNSWHLYLEVTGFRKPDILELSYRKRRDFGRSAVGVQTFRPDFSLATKSYFGRRSSSDEQGLNPEDGIHGPRSLWHRLFCTKGRLDFDLLSRGKAFVRQFTPSFGCHLDRDGSDHEVGGTSTGGSPQALIKTRKEDPFSHGLAILLNAVAKTRFYYIRAM